MDIAGIHDKLDRNSKGSAGEIAKIERLTSQPFQWNY